MATFNSREDMIRKMRELVGLSMEYSCEIERSQSPNEKMVLADIMQDGIRFRIEIYREQLDDWRHYIRVIAVGDLAGPDDLPSGGNEGGLLARANVWPPAAASVMLTMTSGEDLVSAIRMSGQQSKNILPGFGLMQGKLTVKVLSID